MPSFVINGKCDGCKGQDKTACQYICPNDLMVLDKEKNKAFNRAVDMCWECYSCVKICPQQAIEIRCYADFAPLGGSVIPLPGSDSIMWTVKFRNGTIKRFKFPTRTVNPGEVDIFAGEGAAVADLSKIKDQGLFTHQAKGSQLPVPA